MKLLPDNAFDLVAGGIGIIGTAVSVAVLTITGSIRNSLARQALLPDRIRELRELADRLADRPAPRSRDFSAIGVAGKIMGNLAVIKRYCREPDLKSGLTEVHDVLQAYSRKPDNTNLKEIVHQLYGLIVELEDYTRRSG